MSSLIVKVVEVEDIKPHPNADRLELLKVGGWWIISQKGSTKVGDKRMYLPPDSIITEEFGKKWEIDKYCSPQPKQQNGERKPGLRVRAAKIRGIASFGCLLPLEDDSLEVGTNVADLYGITKFNPPPKDGVKWHLPDLPNFPSFTDIEHLNNYPNLFEEGEEVVIDEKIHGTSFRVGRIRDENGKYIFVCGSHEVRLDPEGDHIYALPLKDENIKNYLLDISNGRLDIILYGEIYGCGIQDMQYGCSDIKYRIFDAYWDTQFMKAECRERYFLNEGIPTVPVLYEGPYSRKIVDELVSGDTQVCDPSDIKESFKGREGIVIRPSGVPQYSEELFGRKIAKVVSIDYYTRKNKNATEFH